MPYEPFHERFLEVAERETRSLIVIDDPVLPNGRYGLIEAYCNEPSCDCRRVFFNVYSWQTQETLAVIAYGWESREYYAQWLGRDDPRAIRDLQGPVLNRLSSQSDLAPVLLEKVKYVLQDKRYVARLKRHYKIFREAIDGRQSEKTRRSVRAGRNDPCPCGSGKKYKRCCGK